MIISCIYCGTNFNQEARRGRPSGFCSQKCKNLAKNDPMRLCRTCGGQFHKSEGVEPYWCSIECKGEQATRCLQCGEPAPEGSRFCSAKCILKHSGPKQCQRCQSNVQPSDEPPFNTMPRFCSDYCRNATAQEHGVNRPHLHAEALRLTQLLEYAPKPLWRLPSKSTYVPFNVPFSLAPDIENYQPTAKVQNSIAWWNHILPEIVGWATSHDVPAWVPISYIGRKGYAVSHPTGVLPLYECLPWVTNLTGCDIGTVIQAWRVAAQNKPHSDSQINRGKEKLREWIVEYDEGLWIRDPRRKKFFQANEEGSSSFVKAIRKWQAMHAEPPINMVYLPQYAAILQGTQFQEYEHALNERRMLSRGWKVANYKDDPAPPPDRTLDAIERIIAHEQRRMARQ